MENYIKIIKKNKVWSLLSIMIFYIFTFRGYDYEYLNLGTYMFTIGIFTIISTILYIKKNWEKKQKDIISSLLINLLSIGVFFIILNILFGNQNDWLTFPIYFLIFFSFQIVYIIGHIILYLHFRK